MDRLDLKGKYLKYSDTSDIICIYVEDYRQDREILYLRGTVFKYTEDKSFEYYIGGTVTESILPGVDRVIEKYTEITKEEWENLKKELWGKIN